MNEEKKAPEQEAAKLSEVHVNTDPNAGPLDGAEATVFVAKTRFGKDAEGKTVFKQRRMEGNLKASYSLGVVSISIPGERLMLSVRIDEMMQVMFASAGAYKNMSGKTEEEKEETEDDRKS